MKEYRARLYTIKCTRCGKEEPDRVKNASICIQCNNERAGRRTDQSREQPKYDNFFLLPVIDRNDIDNPPPLIKGPSPCRTCKLYDHCADNKLMCKAFYNWSVSPKENARWGRRTNPSRLLYTLSFAGDKVGASGASGIGGMLMDILSSVGGLRNREVWKWSYKLNYGLTYKQVAENLNGLKQRGRVRKEGGRYYAVIS